MLPTVKITRTAALTLALAMGGLVLAGCGSSTPADRDHICGEYDALSDEAANANGVFDNDVFSTAGQLADLADRYQGTPSLSLDASRLHAIADSNFTNMLALDEATQDIGSLCTTSFAAGLGTSGFGDGGVSGDLSGSGDSNGSGNSDGSTDGQDIPDTTTDSTTDNSDPGTPQPDDEASALAALQQTAAQDQSAVDALVGQWVPQLSSKTDGMVADGITYDDLAIWQKYEQLVADYPQALLLWSGNYTSFSHADYWVVIMPDGSTTGAQANSWCDAQSIPADQCYAKLISHTAGPKGSTVIR